MAATIHQKLASIVEEIDRKGFAELTRLTVLKKWFDRPGRLIAFALWIAEQAAAEDVPASDPAAALLADARALLADVQARGALTPMAMRALHGRLKAFQDEHTNLRWDSVRVVKSKALLLIEEALTICLWHPHDGRLGYKLAAYYCEYYGSGYGSNLNGPSRARVQAIAELVAQRQVDEVAFAQ
ncbi:hypothetical protein F2Q65_14865 [Thiohalocapsa marina]|uniref:Uncharacterized protein n=1 Tax=Thiohalocapsa marina TaxID=424902 RepID=A0A5M8FG83_9GAMM|nr:hypothetical protein [Thiohalocapsa marina]KAA6183719.1 hypothetical protein F2Q65_14865 [Thiohalocapsa marina]